MLILLLFLSMHRLCQSNCEQSIQHTIYKTAETKLKGVIIMSSRSLYFILFITFSGKHHFSVFLSVCTYVCYTWKDDKILYSTPRKIQPIQNVEENGAHSCQKCEVHTAANHMWAKHSTTRCNLPVAILPGVCEREILC